MLGRGGRVQVETVDRESMPVLSPSFFIIHNATQPGWAEQTHGRLGRM